MFAAVILLTFCFLVYRVDTLDSSEHGVQRPGSASANRPDVAASGRFYAFQDDQRGGLGGNISEGAS